MKRRERRMRMLLGNNAGGGVRRFIYTLLAALNPSASGASGILTPLQGAAPTQVATSSVTIPVYESTLAAGPTLKTFDANTPVIPYAGYRDGAWYATDSLGNALGTPTTLASGLVKYTGGNAANPALAVLAEPALTNKITARKRNPTDTTNVTKSGDAASTLAVVDDTAALAAAGLANICNTGKVYKLDNSAGVAAAYAQLGGLPANTNTHSLVIYARKAAGANVTRVGAISGAGNTTITGDTYSRYSAAAFTPANTSDGLMVTCGAGVVTLFILPSLTESTVAPLSTIVDATDGLNSVTRAARYTTAVGSEFSSNVRGQLVLNELGREQWVLGAAATAGVYVGTDNKLNATDGTTTITSTTTLAAGTIYDWGVDWDNGVLYLAEVAEDTDAAMNTPSYAATVFIGAKIGATNVLNGSISVLQSSNDPIAGGTN